MAFCKNIDPQLSFFDSFEQLSERKKRIVLNSYAKYFSDHIYPKINAEIFRELYSDNDASRPSAPIKFVVGALLIKEINDLTDDETVETIHCDVRAQYALHSTSLEEQPISDRTLSRFRERLYNYELKTGRDLLKEVLLELSDELCEMMKINKQVKRMDSLMIATHAKSMTRLEIIYSTVEKCISLLKKSGRSDLIVDELKHYLEADDINDVIYYTKNEDVPSKLQKVINEAILVKHIMNIDEWCDSAEYQLLIRLLNEQTNDGKAKDNSEITSDSLQNPNDPDATYRKKAGKDYKGYVGNIIEAVGEDGASQIVDFQYETNNYSDQQFSKDYIKDNQDETMISDGAYGSVEIQKLAEEKNIEFVSTSLVGKEPDPIFADYQLSEDEKSVIKCAAGHTPIECTYNEKTDSIRMLMNKHDCDNCPFKEKCRAKMQKKSAVVTLSTKMVLRARYIKKLGNEEFKKLTRKRNAVEGVMSVLRRRYRVDEIPVFGKLRSKIFFTMKIGAFNVVKFMRYLGKVEKKSALQGKYA